MFQPELLPRGRSALLALLPICLVLLLGCQPLIQAPPSTPAADLVLQPTPTVAAPSEPLPPVRMRIAALNLDLPIVPMGWIVTENNEGQRTTKWVVPLDAVGWHVNSAPAGAMGNTILSGHQFMGSALFAPLALGDIQVGQEVELVDEAGATFTYKITEVSEPIPLLGASEEDVALAESYMQPSAEAQLTLMTGWPDFTTTHRIFAVAVRVGQ
ncbi:MAG: class F sortase [Caldilineaceae bacterium]